MDQNAARSAIADIERARERALTLRGYAQSGPIFAAWGVGWMVMNLTRHFEVAYADLYGAAATGAAVVVSIVLGKLGRQAEDSPAVRRRASIGGAVFGLSIFGLIILLAPIDRVLTNAVISWLAAGLYVFAGVWLGARISIAGLVLAAVVMGGWLFAREQFELLMGLAGGGVLLVTGFWLWRS